MSSPAFTLHSRLRPLAPRDLEAVIRIDASLRGRARGAYFERRLAAAGRDPERHLQLALDDDGRLAGYMLGRALEGEFGRSEPGAPSGVDRLYGPKRAALRAGRHLVQRGPHDRYRPTGRGRTNRLISQG